MIRRPIHHQFRTAVLDDRKTTTIRATPWPVGVPIMLFNWSGRPYRSPQLNVAPVLAYSATPILITHGRDGAMEYNTPLDRPLYLTEGFSSPGAMDAWFRALVKPGKALTHSLMQFRRVPHLGPIPTPPHA